ncbi:MAG: DJ-1/PfpI family protein [Ruminococcaceae bacterium]|nr:DJ-1/PfpI family protein [Oscillospiraceae bacterium]
MIYMFLAEGFEEVEALCPLDLMRRAGLSVTTVGIGGAMITGAHGITVRSDMSDTEFSALSAPSAELIFLPGGMPGTNHLAASSAVNKAILRANEQDAYIAAICAAPSILGDMGLLKGKEAICYPGFEDHLIGAVLSDKRVAVDGKILTAAGMGVALEFGLTIVSILCGEEKARELAHAVLAC